MSRRTPAPTERAAHDHDRPALRLALPPRPGARSAAAVPLVRLGDPQVGAEQTVDLAAAGRVDGAALIVFPELGLVGYSNQDLFHQQPLIEAALESLDHVRTATSALSTVLVVGLPLRVHHQLFNVAAVVAPGDRARRRPEELPAELPRVLREASLQCGPSSHGRSRLAVRRRRCRSGPTSSSTPTTCHDFVVSVEICEDLWVPIPPSTYAAMAGATVVANLSGSNVTVGKAGYRRELCAAQSARTISALRLRRCRGPTSRRPTSRGTDTR